jgi:hypothetical protein
MYSGSDSEIEEATIHTEAKPRITKSIPPPTDNIVVEPSFAEGFSRLNNRTDIPFEITKVL